jgi:hypothetical protein
MANRLAKNDRNRCCSGELELQLLSLTRAGKPMPSEPDRANIYVFIRRMPSAQILPSELPNGWTTMANWSCNFLA